MVAAGRVIPRQPGEQVKEWSDRLKKQTLATYNFGMETDAASVEISPMYMMSAAPLGAQTYTAANLGI